MQHQDARPELLRGTWEEKQLAYKAFKEEKCQKVSEPQRRESRDNFVTVMSDLRLAGYAEHGGGQNAPPHLAVEADAGLWESIRAGVAEVLQRNGGTNPRNQATML